MTNLANQSIAMDNGDSEKERRWTPNTGEKVELTGLVEGSHLNGAFGLVSTLNSEKTIFKVMLMNAEPQSFDISNEKNGLTSTT